MDPLPNTVKRSLNLWTAREAPWLPFFEKKKKKGNIVITAEAS